MSVFDDHSCRCWIAAPCNHCTDCPNWDWDVGEHLDGPPGLSELEERWPPDAECSPDGCEDRCAVPGTHLGCGGCCECLRGCMVSLARLHDSTRRGRALVRVYPGEHRSWVIGVPKGEYDTTMFLFRGSHSGALDTAARLLSGERV